MSYSGQWQMKLTTEQVEISVIFSKKKAPTEATQDLPNLCKSQKTEKNNNSTICKFVPPPINNAN